MVYGDKLLLWGQGKSAGRVVDVSLPGLQTQPLGKQFMADNAAGIPGSGTAYKPVSGPPRATSRWGRL